MPRFILSGAPNTQWLAIYSTQVIALKSPVSHRRASLLGAAVLLDGRHGNASEESVILAIRPPVYPFIHYCGNSQGSNLLSIGATVARYAACIGLLSATTGRLPQSALESCSPSCLQRPQGDLPSTGVRGDVRIRGVPLLSAN